jgi:hypothetical protein
MSVLKFIQGLWTIASSFAIHAQWLLLSLDRLTYTAG